MKKLGALVFKNAAANIVRGLATAAVALILPHFLIHSLDNDRFAIWALILQIASYISFLDFGLQTAIARFLAHANGSGETERLDAFIATSLALLSGAGVLGIAAATLFVSQAQHFFPGVPPSLLFEFKTAAMTLALGTCLLLPISTYTGILVGLHRNELTAICIGAARICGALAVIVVARYTHSLIAMAAVLTVANLLGGLAQWRLVRSLLPRLLVGWRNVKSAIALQLVRSCSSLSVWALCMLLVSGLDIMIVGHFRFAQVGVYSIAATLCSFYAGLNSSIISALLTPIAALHASGQRQAIASILHKVTRLNAIGNYALLLCCMAFAPAVLKVWVGPEYADRAFPLFAVLILAQALRLVGNPYGVTLIAIGRQNSGFPPAISEALTNLVLSVGGMVWFGSMGVAVGTLAGAVVGVSVLLLWTVPRIHHYLDLTSRDLIQQGLIRPFAVLWPLALGTLFALRWQTFGRLSCLLGLAFAMVLFYRSERGAGIVSAEHGRLPALSEGYLQKEVFE